MQTSTLPTAEPDPISVTVRTACRLMGLGHTTVWKLISEGRLRTIRIGKRRLVLFDSIEQLIASSSAGG